MKITLAQLNPIIGDFDGNTSRLITALEKAVEDKSDLVVFTELYVTGYPPRDLLKKSWFLSRAESEVEKILEVSKNFPGIGILIGHPASASDNNFRKINNSALLIQDGEIIFRQDKSLLPTYDVFDEARYFTPADNVAVCNFKGEVLGILICEDAWNDPVLLGGHYYDTDPVKILADKGATLLINISASPFNAGKDAIRYHLLARHAERHNLPVIFVNQVGANDELIFDGRSMFIASDGSLIKALKPFEEDLVMIDTEVQSSGEKYSAPDEIESIHDALVLGLRDYFAKCGFKKAVVGLSGGIDSAVTAALAAAALGSENVYGVTMPSPYSSVISAQLSQDLASNLGIKFDEIPISEIYEAYRDSLAEPVELGEKINVTLENIQARIRGNILMAISNRFGYIVLSTGNKSESAVGYCTLYGDMAGGLAVISDVPKTVVYKLANYINRDREVIPAGIIDRAPSAELRPNQKDQDTLPEYEILDGILELYIDDGVTPEEIIAAGYDSGVVKWVIKAVHRNEYKRRQAAPGLKVTSKAFGTGRRMPIAARYHEF